MRTAARARLGASGHHRARPLFALLALLLAPAVDAVQPPRPTVAFASLSTADGLSQATVTAIAQDPRGFLWFGTQEGLNRYDGRRFSVFTRGVDEPGSLGSEHVRALLVDHGGELWVGTDGGGLARLLPDGGFRTFRHDPDDPGSLGHDTVRALLEDRSGRLWIGTDGGGVGLWQPATDAFASYRHDPDDDSTLPSDRISALAQAPGGKLWVATDGGGLALLDPDSGRCRRFRHRPGDPTSLGSDRLRTLHADAGGTLWIGTYEAGLDRFDPVREQFGHLRHDRGRPGSLASDRVRHLFRSGDGSLWVATDGGLSELAAGADGFRHYRHDPADPHSLRDDRVTMVFQDRGGVLWVGTYAGLSRSNLVTGRFSVYRHDPRDPSTLSSSVVTSFHEDRDGSVWVGTYGGGLNRFERISQSFTRYRHEPENPGSLGDDRVMALLVDRLGSLWVGTRGSGLSVLEPGKRSFRHYRHDPADPTSLAADAVTSILEDRSGNVWVGTFQGGLHRFDRHRDRFVRYQHEPGNPDSPGSDRVITLYEDRAGVLWIGTDNAGLDRFDPASGRFTHFRHDPADPASLGGERIMAIHEDAAGRLWIGTHSAGLHRRDPGDPRGAFRRYGKREGLLSSAIYGIQSDGEGNLWLTSNRGLSRLDPEHETFRHYDTSHGLQSDEFNGGAHYRTRDGEMYFGGPAGFNAFYPARLTANQHRPPVEITAFLKFNQPVELERPLSATREIIVGHQDSIIGFDFVALDYTAPHKNRYRYMLEGFDERWVAGGTLGRATYTNLSAGRYTFRVQGSNNDGLWNEAGASVGLRVLPPPWRSWWAYLLYAGLLAGGLVTAVRIQSRERERATALAAANRSLEQQIVERERVQVELHKLSLAVEQSPASVMITDPRGVIEYVNPKFEEVTGYRRDEILGQPTSFLESGYLAPEMHREMWRTVAAGRDWRGELHRRKKGGELFWEHASLSPIKDERGRVEHVLAIHEDITVRKEYEEQLLHQAHFDSLTGLPNRILALDRLERALAQSRQRRQRVGLMFVDLDNFKIVNDTLGHATGDELLVATARRLAACLRESDTVARLGGDEFLVILNDLDEEMDTELVAAKILGCFSQPFDLDGRDIFVTASLGITVAPTDGNDPHVLLRNADAAMYKAKEKGRNTYQFFTPAMNEQAMERLRLENNLRRALEEGELRLEYQPIFDLADGGIVAAEALLRWNSPKLGAVPPEQFVPVAEETGLIVPIGEWVLEQACREAAGWRRPDGAPLRVAVNVSARQFKGSDLGATVERVLKTSGLPPEQLELEITEGLVMDDEAGTTEALEAIHGLGVRFSVDDFGTGYSALSYLKTYPFDTIKIDREFVGHLVDKTENRAVVVAIIALGRSLGLEVLGEGVETGEQLEFLTGHRCHLAQGFALARPMPAGELAELLRAQPQAIGAPARIAV